MSEKQTWACDQLLKANNWSAKNFLKKCDHDELAPEAAIQSCDTGQQIHFWQLSIDRNTDVYYQVIHSLQASTLGRKLKGAFLWDDLDQNQWFKITRIIVDQMNWWILVQSGFIGSFDLPWFEWSQVTDPDPNHLKGMHPNISSLFPCGADRQTVAQI